MLNDLRYALRQILKAPGFSIVAILTLALGIGANTAIFSLINTILLKPLPYPDSHDLVQVEFRLANGGRNNSLSGGIFLDFQRETTQLASVSAIHASSLNLTGIEDPQRLSGLEVSPSFLKTLGIKLPKGSFFTEENENAGGNKNVVVLSHELWQNQFGADPDIVGSLITLDYQSYTVLGVLPPNPFAFSGTDYLAPTALGIDQWKQVRRYDYVCQVIGRLKDGATIESAQAEFAAIKAALNEQFPDFMKPFSIAVLDLQEAYYGNLRPYVLTLLVAVGLVLLVACVNVANLLIARATARQGELSVRSALGASRWSLTRQLLCESLLLALLGGILGLVFAILSLKPLALLVQLNLITTASLTIDLRVLLFTLFVSLGTGVFFGMFPALKAGGRNIAVQIRESTRSATRSGGNTIQSALVISEVALTVALLVAVGLLLKSFTNAFQTDPGFNRENILTFEISRSSVRSPQPEDYVRFTEQVIERLEQIPGVQSAAMISTTPMNGQRFYGAPFWRDDLPDTANTYFTGFDCVNGNIFQTLGIPLLTGRYFDKSDQLPDSKKVVIINEQVVKDQFAGVDPIGKLVRHDGQLWEVVGVVGSIARFSLDTGQQPMTYKPQMHWPWASSYVVKTQLPPLAIADQVKEAIHSVDPEQPIFQIRTLENAVKESLSGRVIMASLIGIFGIVSVFLAATGLYGLMVYLVEQRNREIGIRLAVGALPQEIVRMIFARGLTLTGIGLAIGILAVLGLGRYLSFILYQVEPYDPYVLLAVVSLTLFITAVACWKPAKAASRIHPSNALRLE